MNTSDRIIGLVRDVVLSALDPDMNDVSDEEELLLSGLLDSMAVISITSELERRFQIEIQAMDITIENFESISAIAHYLYGQIND